MKIGIIVAMSKELALLKPLLKSPNTVNINGFEFTEGQIAEHTVVALQCGIGKVNASVGTMVMVYNFSPDMIINTGVAGGAAKSVNVMDVVVGEKVAYHDVWCGPECKVGVIQGLPDYFMGSQAILSKLPESNSIKTGLIVSGDQFIESIEKVNIIKTNYPEALAVDMESGAIAHVCELMKIPFLSLRVISDSPGASHNSTIQYDNFWEDAPKQSFAIVEKLLNNL